MALSTAGLSAAMKTEIENIAEIVIVDDDGLKRFTDAVAKAVVEHIQANAVVNTTVSVTVTGVQGGLGSAPGTGSGTGTVT